MSEIEDAIREQNENSESQMKEFLEDYPLYSRYEMDIPGSLQALYPGMIEIHCPNCGTERPFRETGPSSGSNYGGTTPAPASGIHKFEYRCAGCGDVDFQSWVQVDVDSGWIRKVGQYPPWNINVSSDVASELGEDEELYKRARVCMSQSYGIGACAYLRRLIENQIDPILDLLQDINEEEGNDEGIEEIEEVIRSTNFTDKSRVAYRVAPESIVVEGTNPLKIIHDRLSEGLHTLPEEECMEVARQLASAVEYVVVELNRRQRAREEFADQMRSMS